MTLYETEMLQRKTFYCPICGREVPNTRLAIHTDRGGHYLQLSCPSDDRYFRIGLTAEEFEMFRRYSGAQPDREKP